MDYNTVLQLEGKEFLISDVYYSLFRNDYNSIKLDSGTVSFRIDSNDDKTFFEWMCQGGNKDLIITFNKLNPHHEIKKLKVNGRLISFNESFNESGGYQYVTLEAESMQMGKGSFLRPESDSVKS